MGEVVDITGKPVQLKDDHEFVVDLARFAEGITSEEAIRKKYRLLDNDAWGKLGEGDELVRAIEAEKVRRVRNGDSKREKSQLLITKAPGILDGIMSDPSASPRAPRRRDQGAGRFCRQRTGRAPASDRFVITINLGSDTLRFDKSIEVNPNDIDPFNNTGVIAAIAAKKKDGGSGEPV